MKETIQDLKDRRSYRRYQSKQIKDEELEMILDAGTYAPTGMGAQSPIIIAIQNPQIIRQLSQLNAAVMGNEGMDPFYGAPTVVVVLANKAKITCVEDGSLVLGNMMNAAHALGLGSCWIHRAKEVFETKAGKELLNTWGFDGDHYVGVGHCILGYPDSQAPAVAARKEGYVTIVK